MTTGCIFTVTAREKNIEKPWLISKSIQCIQCRTDSHNLFVVRIAHLPGDPADGELFCLGFSHGCVPHEAIWGPGWISFGAGKWCRELDMGPVEHQGNSRAPCAFAT